jgi:hypothetical protein
MVRHLVDGRRAGWRLLLALPALAALLATGCVAEATWALQNVALVEPPRAPTVELTWVDCPAPGACVATGVLHHGPWPNESLVLRQAGSGWERVDLPGTIGSTFAGVSCRAVDDCLVVGDPLDVHLDAAGPTWVLAPGGPHADTADETVDCVADGCLRVRGDGSWWWDGSTWGPRVGLPAGFQPSERRLACTSSTQCVAIASEAWIHGLVEGPMPGPVTATEWDGSSWSPVATIDQSRGAGLACPAVDSCFATLGIRTSRQWPPLPTAVGMTHWDGTTWSTVPLTWPGTAPTEPPMLACDGASSCTFQTVRGWLMGGPDYLGRWNGATWTVSPAPAARFLDVMSCASAGDCVAVGEAAAQRLSGTVWADMSPVASAPDPSVLLQAVSCASPDLCLALGQDIGSAGLTPAFRVFDGTSWTVPAGTSPGGGVVDCVPDTACIVASALGAVQRWDGTSFSPLDPIPVPTGSFARVLDLDCPGAAWCIAIAGTGEVGDAPIAVTWTPSTGWSPLALPPLAGLVLEEGAVACDAPESCVAATRTSAGLVFQRLSGGAWSSLPTPPAQLTSLKVTDIDCPMADMCAVVGLDRDSSRPVRAVLRDGAWDVFDPGPGIGLTSEIDCWAPDGCVVSTPDRMAVLRGSRWLALTQPGTQVVHDVSCPEPFTCEVVGELADGDARSPAARVDLEPPG